MSVLSLPTGGRASLCAAFATGVLFAASSDQETSAAPSDPRGVVADPVTPTAAASAASGIPDFEVGEGLGWREIGDTLLPPPNGPLPVTQDQRYPYRFGRNYRVADTNNPILQPWAREQMEKSNASVLAGEIGFRPRERCLPGGVPEFDFYARVEEYYFLQGPKEVTLLNSGGPEIRHIFLNVPHSANPKISWYGESVGHYEGGDTLVVDTIGLSPKSYVDDFRTPHTDKLHVIERFKLSPDHKHIETLITIDDPGAFTTQWTAMQRFNLQRRPLTESPCAENNENFFNYKQPAMPTSDKPDF
ncbi:MAG TPA: hypothetical protein VFW28_18175 [Micropepsaceae bacterium]|nr:hypothetical protein [Micropepsaceae bacterium]